MDGGVWGRGGGEGKGCPHWLPPHPGLISSHSGSNSLCLHIAGFHPNQHHYHPAHLMLSSLKYMNIVFNIIFVLLSSSSLPVHKPSTKPFVKHLNMLYSLRAFSYYFSFHSFNCQLRHLFQSLTFFLYHALHKQNDYEGHFVFYTHAKLTSIISSRSTCQAPRPRCLPDVPGRYVHRLVVFS